MTLVDRVSWFFLAALALCLVGYSLVSYVLIRNYLYRQFDQQLYSALHVLVAAVETEEDGVKWQPSDHTITLGDGHVDDDVRWVIVDDRGRIVDRSRNLSPSSNVDKLLVELAQSERPITAEPSGDQAWRLLQSRLTAGAPKPPLARDPDEFASVTVTVARAPSGLTNDLWRLAVLVSLLPATLWSVAAVVGRKYVRRALAPVSAMASRARSMTQADFHLRLAVAEPPDELADLAAAFNELLDQLQRAFEQQRRFTGDAAHQLRTPLTVLRGQIDVVLRRPRVAEEYREVLVTLSNQTQELQQLVETLLYLARAEEESVLLETHEVILEEWLPVYLDRWKLESRATDFVVEIDPAARVTAAVPLLSQALDNLLGNAAKYSQPGTPITVRVTCPADSVAISIADEGIGIAVEDRQFIFNPFFRTAAVRQLGVEGVGLGLALVARIAKALRGRIEFAENQPHGSRFTLFLPAAVQ